MSPELIGILAVIFLFLLLLLGIPIAFALGFVSFLGYTAIAGIEPALRIIGAIPYAKVASYTFTVVPLFIIMGHFAYHAGIARDMMQTAQKWVGGFPGGLVQSTIAGATALGAACGSGLASCAVVSKVTIPDMLRVGVNRSLAFGAVASAGTIAQMIPPSILMVIYGIISEQSVGKLLIAGIFPGLLLGVSYMVMVYIRVKRNPTLALPLKGITWKERLISLKGMWGIVVLAIIVMGGIYLGIFTPTEAGAVGAFGAFLIALRRLKWHDFYETLLDTMRTTSMIFLLISCAFVFGYLISISRLVNAGSEFLVTLPPWGLLAGVMVLYIILGFFLDMIAAMFITLPVILPAMNAAGFNLVWFGVLMVLLCEMALITPPYGLNLYVLKGVIPDAKLGEIISGIWPFFAVMIVDLIILIVFPQIALFLPNLMK